MSEPGATQPHPLSEHGRRHGKPSSWAVVAVAIIAFAAGGAALILGMWILFYFCAGIFALSAPVGLLVGIMDDTVLYVTPPQGRRSKQLGADSGGHVDRH